MIKIIKMKKLDGYEKKSIKRIRARIYRKGQCFITGRKQDENKTMYMFNIEAHEVFKPNEEGEKRFGGKVQIEGTLYPEINEEVTIKDLGCKIINFETVKEAYKFVADVATYFEINDPYFAS